MGRVRDVDRQIFWPALTGRRQRKQSKRRQRRGLAGVYLARFPALDVFVREGISIKRPEDLPGKRIGVLTWAQTSGIYGRGYLSDYVGLKLKDIQWIQAGVNQPVRKKKVKLKLPEGIERRNVPDTSLNDMLLRGELDTVMSVRPPAGFGPGVVCTMPDYQALEAH